MRTPSFHMNSGSHYKFNQWDPPFMLDDGVCINGTQGVHQDNAWFN